MHLLFCFCFYVGLRALKNNNRVLRAKSNNSMDQEAIFLLELPVSLLIAPGLHSLAYEGLEASGHERREP